MDLYLALQVVPYGAGQSLLLVRDVTRQMRLEAMRKDFVANASHELRTPLTVISGYLDTLADDRVHRSGLGRSDPGHARPGAAYERHHRRPAGAVAARVHRRRGAARSDRRAGDARARCIATRWRTAIGRARCSLDLESADGLFGVAHEIESAFTNLLVNGAEVHARRTAPCACAGGATRRARTSR